MVHALQPPSSCIKCGGSLVEGLAVDNSKIVPEGYPAYGKKLKLGGSASWWRLVPAEKNARKAGPLPGADFEADKVVAGERFQIFTYRCEQCGYLESYAPQAD
jgi:predicted nucleic-acid-binding Zn-ribbon protein